MKLKIKDHQTLILSCIFSLVVVIIRVLLTAELRFIFLVWNLLLAIIPYLMALKAQHLSSKIKSSLLILFSILFLPNASYIITDLFHLRFYSGSLIWLDTVLILSFALNGLWFFFLSISEITNWFTKNTFIKREFSITFILVFLSSFGMYLGRYLRFNSWDILANPVYLFYEIADRFFNPFLHPRTWGMTVLYSGFLFIAYLAFKQSKIKVL